MFTCGLSCFICCRSVNISTSKSSIILAVSCLEAITFMKQSLRCMLCKSAVICFYFIHFSHPLVFHQILIECLCCVLAKTEIERRKKKKRRLPALHKSSCWDKQKCFKEFDDSFRGPFYLFCISIIHKYYEVMIICFVPDQGNWISWATDEIDFSKKRTLVSCFSRFFFFLDGCILKAEYMYTWDLKVWVFYNNPTKYMKENVKWLYVNPVGELVRIYFIDY